MWDHEQIYPDDEAAVFNTQSTGCYSRSQERKVRPMVNRSNAGHCGFREDLSPQSGSYAAKGEGEHYTSASV